MDVVNTNTVNGSLQISTDVVAKIARLAAMEVNGVKDICAAPGVKSLLGKPKSVSIDLLDDVAEITLNIIVFYGSKIPAICEKVQQNVKASVQNMTTITVSKVNVVVVGVQVKIEDME